MGEEERQERKRDAKRKSTLSELKPKFNKGGSKNLRKSAWEESLEK